jgi:protein required for attachment to host cells
MKQITTWIVFADGAKARIACSTGKGKGLKVLLDEEHEASKLRGRDLLSDRPARTFSSAGAGSHMVQPASDPREVEKHKFVRHLCDLLTKGLNDGRYDQLVLVAPPRVLGELRSTLSGAVKQKVTAELAKDLTNTPAHDLARHLDGVVMT